jgi:hypothetical protein
MRFAYLLVYMIVRVYHSSLFQITMIYPVISQLTCFPILKVISSALLPFPEQAGPAMPP